MTTTAATANEPSPSRVSAWLCMLAGEAERAIKDGVNEAKKPSRSGASLAADVHRPYGRARNSKPPATCKTIHKNRKPASGAIHG